MIYLKKNSLSAVYSNCGQEYEIFKKEESTGL